MEQPRLSPYITLADAARVLGTTPAEVDVLAERGVITSHQEDAQLYVRRLDVYDLAAARKSG